MMFKSKINPLILLGILSLSYSCKKESSDNVDLKNAQNKIFEPINKVLIIDEISQATIYYTKDSLSKITINDGILNNLGYGRDTTLKKDGLTIFKNNISLRPIVNIDINESVITKYVVSFNKLKAKTSSDSVRIKSMIFDSSYIPSYDESISSTYNTTLLDSTIYINLVYVKKFGTISLDLKNPNFNNFLSDGFVNYSTNGLNANSTTKNQFRNIYGDVFKYSMLLGESLICEIEVKHAEFDNNSQELALNEAVSLLKDYKNGNKSWDELKINSKYLKKSKIYDFIKTTIPGSNFGFDFKQDINYLEGIYKKSDFGILSFQHKPFSVIYPNNDFFK